MIIINCIKLQYGNINMTRTEKGYKTVSIDGEIVARIEKLRQRRAEKDYLINEAPMTQLIRGLLNEALRREGV